MSPLIVIPATFVAALAKDDRHRTRALITPDGREIGISGNQAVFALIGNIQGALGIFTCYTEDYKFVSRENFQ